MEKILLSTYIIKVRHNKNDEILNRFNGRDDFFAVFMNYLNNMANTMLHVREAKQASRAHLVLASPPQIDYENRTVYGFLSSGVSGEKYKIRDVDTNDDVMDVMENHAAFRSIFYYVSMPSERRTGALILQRRAKFGIKGVFYTTLNEFVRGQGFDDCRIFINNILHGQVYRKMMQEGNLKKVDFIRRKIPRTIEQLWSRNQEPYQIPGILKTTIMSPSSLPQAFKETINRFMTQPENERIEIEGMEDIDEIEFELELNGHKKTFYIVNRTKSVPDVDVSNELSYQDGEPTISSLVSQAEILIKDLIDFRTHLNADKN